MRLRRSRPTRASRPTQSHPSTRARAIPTGALLSLRPRPKSSRKEWGAAGGRDHRRHRGGKSEALAAFARHGAATISSDEVVHELYRDEDVRAALRERFGDGIFDGDEVIRAALGAIVFADRGELGLARTPLAPQGDGPYRGLAAKPGRPS